jgi:fructose-specific phosphotransferase system IIA component
MRISDILTEQVIAVGLEGSSKDDVLEKMIELVGKSASVKDLDKVRNAILERERIMSTGVGRGVAVPHGKTDGVTETVAAFALLAEPIDYKALDDQPVHLVFLLIGRENSVGVHLKLLSRISRLMSNEQFRTRLLAAADAAAVLELFRKDEEHYFEN